VRKNVISRFNPFPFPLPWGLGTLASLFLVSAAHAQNPSGANLPVPFGEPAPSALGPNPLTLDLLIVNDNYTGNAEAGKKGRYLGADDFLTVSYLLNGRVHESLFDASIHSVTSRKYGYRYDLLSTDLGRSGMEGLVHAAWRTGITYRGDLGGSWIQNGFHDFKGFPEVDLPYLKSRWGIWGSLDFEETRRGFAEWDGWTGRLGMRLAWRNIPNEAKVDFGYAYRYGMARGESFVGYRYRFNSITRYSEFLRKGPLWGTALQVGNSKGWSLQTGILFFPARNLQADPAYEQKVFRYSPQIWTGVSFNRSTGGLQGMLGYL
jgi:hypothetical protein